MAEAVAWEMVRHHCFSNFLSHSLQLFASTCDWHSALKAGSQLNSDVEYGLAG
jgi:hypothetical protein